MTNWHRRGVTVRSLSLHGFLVCPLCYGSCHMGISTLYPLETRRLTSWTQPPDTNVDILCTASSKRTISSAPQIPLSTTSVPSQGDPFMCLGVATVARQSVQQYVRGNIDSLLRGLSEQERRSIYLMPCIAHTRHSDHHGRQEPRLANLSVRVLEYELSEDHRARL